ncbi:MAG: hypothetical protein AAGA54_35235 [Myxococcota bacterium]
MRRRTALLVALVSSLAACEKAPADAGTKAPAAAPSDPVDKATATLMSSLQSGDYDGLRAQTVDPLTHDLSRAEFDDLSSIVQWLGPVQEQTVTKSDDNYGGGQKWYALQCDKGSKVELEVSIDEGGKLIGFVFGGKGYQEAERGVLAEPWREFKVYDFALLDADGNALPKDAPVAGKRVEYEIVVGGIEALLGEHHLTIEKIVLDADGNEVFHEPIEFDTKFDEDAMGIPRGSVRGYVEVPGPGSWTMDLVIFDQNAHRDIEYKKQFATK